MLRLRLWLLRLLEERGGLGWNVLLGLRRCRARRLLAGGGLRLRERLLAVDARSRAWGLAGDEALDVGLEPQLLGAQALVEIANGLRARRDGLVALAEDGARRVLRCGALEELSHPEIEVAHRAIELADARALIGVATARLMKEAHRDARGVKGVRLRRRDGAPHLWRKGSVGRRTVAAGVTTLHG